MRKQIIRLRIATISLLLSTGIFGVIAFTADSPSEKSEAILAKVQIDRAPLDRENPDRVTSYADVLDEVRPAVVSVFSTRVVREREGHPLFGDELFERFFGVPRDPGGRQREQRRQGLGSGVIVTENGYLLTNNHVIEGADEIRVALTDGREFDAEMVGTDPKTDIAILKIEAEDLPVARLTDSDNIRVGDVTFALGNPLGVGQTVTMGIVSATGRRQIGILGQGGYEDFIQTDAAINQGNSGGPLVDGDGRVIGINTAILSRSGGNIGIGFAIPANLAANVMESLIRTGTVERGFLGVNPQDLTSELAEDFDIPDGRGVLIAYVVPDSPADKAGLEPGDVVLRVNDRRVTSASELRLRISQMTPGSAISLEIVRDGETQTIELDLGRLDDDALVAGGQEQGELLSGVLVAPLTPETRRDFDLPDDLSGILVVEVAGDSPHVDQIPAGAVIVEINRQPVESVRSARQLIRPGRNNMRINFRGNFQFISIFVE